MNYRDMARAGMSPKVVQALAWLTRDERWYQQRMIKELPRYERDKAQQRLQQERKASEELNV